MARVRLFVYGSLKRGGRHHDELAGAVFLGEATTVPGYRLEPLGEYLALVSAPPERSEPEAAKPSAEAEAQPEPEHETETATAVPGELFEVDESKLEGLDAFEGDAYERGNVRLAEKPGLALAYFRKAR